MRLPYRLRRLWRDLCLYMMRPPPPQPDADAAEIARIEALIGRLEVAASIGSIAAAGQLACMAEDRVGHARRQMAKEAIARLQSSRFKAIRI